MMVSSFHHGCLWLWVGFEPDLLSLGATELTVYMEKPGKKNRERPRSTGLSQVHETILQCNVTISGEYLGTVTSKHLELKGDHKDW